MFVTYNSEGIVTAYSDKERNTYDLLEGEKQAEVDMEWTHVSCKENGLTYSIENGLCNEGVKIASTVTQN